MHVVKRIIALFLTVALLSAAGCVKAERADDTKNDRNDDEKESVKRADDNKDSYNFNEVGLSSGEALEWPEYIPDAIPELKGEISLIFADDYTIRIFFNGVSRDDLEEYIKTMKNYGYKEEYILYVQEGFADNSKEREKKGDFDAVKFIKDNYEITVEQGEDVAVMDIASNKFSQAEKDIINQAQNPQYKWPDSLFFPQPEGCEIETVQNLDDGSLYILCVYENDNNINEYVEILQQIGFEKVKQNKNQNDKIIDIVMIKDDTAVEINANVSSQLSFNIWFDGKYTAPEEAHPQVIDGNWPSTLPEAIPPFTKGTVDSALDMGDNRFLIMITATEKDAFDNYIELLLQNGFSQQSGNEEYAFTDGEYGIILKKLMMSDYITIEISKQD